jgi:vacuolar-type H+-ATPase subunit E/Vma4
MRADKALQDEIAINTKEYKQFITDEIKATVCKAKLVGNKLVADAGMMAYNNDLSMWKKAGQSLSKPNSLSQIMDAFRKQTADELRNLTKTTGFKGTVLQPVMSAYQREMDMALVKLATGTFSYDQICNDVVHNLAQSGLRTIDYASGRSYQLDTAARMSVRTGMSQLSGRITEANIESTGVDLVITSQHMGSRPEHAEWQNKVFCYKGKTKKYPNFEESTGYGTVTGLKGANCSHDFYPYWEGISVKVPDVKEPAPVMVDGKEYDYYSATQKQRQMERNIRATKREIEAQKAIGGDTSILQANLRKQTADYKKFSVDVDIRAKNNRLKVVSGSSDY